MYKTLRLTLLLLIIFSAMIVNAKPQDCIILSLQYGNRVVFMLQDNPQIEFMQHGINISTENYTFEELSSYSFGDSENLPSGLNELFKPQQAFMQNGIIYINPSKTNASISLHTILGVEIKCPINRISEKSYTIDLNSLPIGVYLLSIDNETLKFLKQ